MKKLKYNEYPCSCDDGYFELKDYFGNFSERVMCDVCDGRGYFELSEELEMLNFFAIFLNKFKRSVSEKMRIVDTDETHGLETLIDFIRTQSENINKFIQENHENM
jgi:hypothetical protein